MSSFRPSRKPVLLEVSVETVDPKKVAAAEEATLPFAGQCLREQGITVPAGKRLVVTISFRDDSAVLDLPAWGFFSLQSLRDGGCPCVYAPRVSEKMHRQLRLLAQRLGSDVDVLALTVRQALADQLFLAASLERLMPPVHYAGLLEFMKHHHVEFL